MQGARSNKDSPANERFNALVAEQKSIKEQQQANKGTRTAQQEKVNSVDSQIKALIKQQQERRGKLPYKNEQEIDAQIDRLTKDVDSGRMKLVDEKKALAEVSSLRKQRKGFSDLNDIQKRIDEKKAEYKGLKDGYDSKETRELSQKYEDNQKELDEIKAGREGTRKNYESTKAEGDKLYNEQKATYAKMREIKDAFHQQRKAYKEHEDMVYQQRRERQKAERDAYEKERRKKRAEQVLEEASNKAYMDEIRLGQSLLAHFDPSSRSADSSKDESKFAATAQRTVDESGPKGMKIMKKEEEDFFIGGAGKKKGKGKKSAAAEGGKYNLDFGTIEGLGKLGIEPPTSQAEVPAVVEKLKEKLEFYKKDQDRQTTAVSSSLLVFVAIADLPTRTLKPRKRRSNVWRRRFQSQHLHLLQRKQTEDVATIVRRKSQLRTPVRMAILLPKLSCPRRKTPPQMSLMT